MASVCSWGHDWSSKWNQVLFQKADPQNEILGLHCSRIWWGHRYSACQGEMDNGVCSEITLLKLSAAAARDGVQMAGRHGEITFLVVFSGDLDYMAHATGHSVWNPREHKWRKVRSSLNEQHRAQVGNQMAFSEICKEFLTFHSFRINLCIWRYPYMNFSSVVMGQMWLQISSTLEVTCCCLIESHPIWRQQPFFLPQIIGYVFQMGPFLQIYYFPYAITLKLLTVKWSVAMDS